MLLEPLVHPVVRVSPFHFLKVKFLPCNKQLLKNRGHFEFTTLPADC
jgi:hypothetical protein